MGTNVENASLDDAPQPGSPASGCTGVSLQIAADGVVNGTSDCSSDYGNVYTPCLYTVCTLCTLYSVHPLSFRFFATSTFAFGFVAIFFTLILNTGF